MKVDQICFLKMPSFKGASLMTARELVRKWRRRTACLAAALCASVATTIPFLNGYFLHGYWDEVGKYILIGAMVLLVATVGAAAYAYSFWAYDRELEKIKGPDSSRDASG